MRHRSIQSTMIYIMIENTLFQHSNDEFHCRAAKLIEAGFEYVTTFNGVSSSENDREIVESLVKRHV
ncbi:hypothetical protein KEJ27_04055 [Candidatus Bathyarchaeota archaeon]|nr:hypothetical protein [Candidatus Bathyarchaeota archaeon]